MLISPPATLGGLQHPGARREKDRSMLHVLCVTAPRVVCAGLRASAMQLSTHHQVRVRVRARAGV